MLEELKKNIEQEKAIISQMKIIESNLRRFNNEERRFYLDSLNALKNQLRILNNATPPLLNKLSPLKKLDNYKIPSDEKDRQEETRKEENNLVKLSYVTPGTGEKRFITINKEDKEKFAKELSLSEGSLKGLQREDAEDKKLRTEEKPSQIARISNIFFARFSERIAPHFNDVREDLKQANSRFLISTYISVALFVSMLVFLSSLFFIGILAFVDFSYIKWIWVAFALLGFSLVGFYLYPSSEKSTVEKNISDEIPFAAIYMAAIAGSDIEPTKIFKIISDSPDYPEIGKEIKRVIHQTEIYGSDLVSSLKNSSKRTPSVALSELFNGLATNIVSGGSLKSYLEKKSENLMLDYRLKRQKYTALAETFMDIYISILITAPLVLMMLIIIMSISGIGIGLSVNSLLILTIGGVVLVNIIFLAVLKFKQPKI